MNGESSGGSGIRVRLFGRTDVGQVREHNEDNFLIADLTRKSRSLMEVDRVQAVSERGTVLGVCDGMRGAAAGEVASQLAGDIRAYVLRGDKFFQVSRDQALVNQLIEAGQLPEEEAETFEHNNIILQALGTAESVQVDLTYVDLRRGDVLILCSDGLSGMIRSDE